MKLSTLWLLVAAALLGLLLYLATSDAPDALVPLLMLGVFGAVAMSQRTHKGHRASSD